jgi:hypothetical protein
MAHAAVALQTDVSLHLARALGHVSGGGGDSGPAGGFTHRARNGLQEEVRHNLMQAWRERRLVDESARRRHASKVPLIRSVCAKHPAAVDFRIAVQEAACQAEDKDDGVQGVPSLADADRPWHAAAETQRPRALLRRAVVGWLFHRLGLQSEPHIPHAVAQGRSKGEFDPLGPHRSQTCLQVMI